MKVYLVMDWAYENTFPDKVFATQELAEEYVRQEHPRDADSGWLHLPVERYEAFVHDEPIEFEALEK